MAVTGQQNPEEASLVERLADSIYRKLLTPRPEVLNRIYLADFPDGQIACRNPLEEPCSPDTLAATSQCQAGAAAAREEGPNIERH